jgi:tetratricopeptide (TPR) repeat protein
VDARKDGLTLTPEKRRVLRRRLRPAPSGRTAEIARIHRPEAYSARAARAGALPFGLAAVAVFLWWAHEEGGYAPTAWYPGALIFLALLVGVAISSAGPTSSGLWVTRALAFLAAFTAWSFLSIVWAGVKGDAWDGANRTLLYLTVYATFALLCWRARDAAIVVGLIALGTAAVGAAAFASEGASTFIDGRLAAPTGYANASAALFLAAFWPAVALAARPEVHWAARSVLLAAGGLLLQLAVLAQSRASVVAGSIAFLLYVVVSQERVRALLALLPVAALTLASLGPLLDVFASATQAELEEAVAREQQTLTLSTGALLAIGALVAFMDGPGRIGRRVRLLSGRRRTVVAAVAAGGVLVALVAAAGVASLTDGSGRDVVSSGATSALGSSRFGGGLETGRYDLWRVAAGEVADHPLLGVGADNFAVDFARERRTREEPLYPHSLFLRSLSQTGLVGGALFLGFVGAALVAALRRRRRSDALANAVASASVVSAVYWLLHGSIDWLWEIPALAASALALLGLAAGLRQPRPDRPLSTPRRSVPALAAAGVLVAAAVGSYTLPGLAALEVERAVQAWPEAPDRTFSRLERARRLNPLTERPDVVAGALAQRAGQPDRARIAFQRVLERNPDEWYAHLQLALLDAADGRRGEALAHLVRARSLNPLEPALQDAEDALFAGALLRQQLVLRVDRLAVPSPLGRRPVDLPAGTGARESMYVSRRR